MELETDKIDQAALALLALALALGLQALFCRSPDRGSP
jgi:hypothetical protein